jgi:hypothetical protein
MDMPKPGEAHSRLNALLGEWAGAETLYPSPWDPGGGTATSRTVNRAILDGFAIMQEYEQRRGKTVTFRGHGIFWWDAATSQYAMTWWDTMGGVSSEFRGAFSGDVLELVTSMTPSGAFRMTYGLSRPGRHTFKMERSEDGQTWQPAMDGNYEIAGGAKTSKKKAVKKAAKKAARTAKPARAAKASKAAKKSPMKATAKKAGAKKAKKAKRRR